MSDSGTIFGVMFCLPGQRAQGCAAQWHAEAIRKIEEKTGREIKAALS